MQEMGSWTARFLWHLHIQKACMLVMLMQGLGSLDAAGFLDDPMRGLKKEK